MQWTGRIRIGAVHNAAVGGKLMLNINVRQTEERRGNTCCGTTSGQNVIGLYPGRDALARYFQPSRQPFQERGLLPLVFEQRGNLIRGVDDAREVCFNDLQELRRYQS